MPIFNILEYQFIRRAYLAGTLIAALCASIGIYLLLRKLSLIGDGLSHVSFGAIALGLLWGIYPLYVALPVVLGASLFILTLNRRATLYGDAAIGIVSSVGIASGIIFASISEGFNVDLFAYLFGSILAIGQEELYLAAILSLSVGAVVCFFYHDLFSVTFDEEYAHISGIKVKAINLLLMSITAIAVVLAVKIVGVTLVSALLILPAATALQLARSFRIALIAAILFAVFSLWVGIALSFYLDLPTGAVVVLINFLFFIGAFIIRKKAV